MAIKESALAAITSITQSDFVRAVTSAGASRRITVANLAKAIVENYTGSSLAGKSQSVKAALDSLNSKRESLTPTDVQNGTFEACNVITTGAVISLFVQFATNTAMSSSNEYILGTIPAGYRPALYASLGGSNCVGSILAGGTMRVRPISPISSGGKIYLAATFVKA